MTTTFEQLRAFLVKDYQLEPARVTLDAPLVALGIDSLGLVDMLFNIEDDFHITLPTEAVALSTIGDVVTFIDELIAAQSGQSAHRIDTSPSGAVPIPLLLTP